jgi:DNA (cytosine-5)-methyltransferase 1
METVPALAEKRWIMPIGKPKFVSLFSGCGGFDLGFAQAGFHCAGAFDIEEDVIQTHRLNFHSGSAILDLTDSAPDPGAFRHLDAVIAGPPCQGFSTAGKRDLKDPRNTLLVRAAEVAVRLKPKVVLIENVAGVVSGPQRTFWDSMLGILRSADYRVAEIRCDASKMGVPQRRKRVVALGWSAKKDLDVVLPEGASGTLRDALACLKDVPNHAPRPLDPKSKAGIIARHIGPNQKLCNVRASERSVHTWDIPEVFGKTSHFERLVLSAMLHRRRQKRIRDFGDADPVTARAIQQFVGRPVAAVLRELVDKGYVRRIGKFYDLVHTFNGKFRRLLWQEPAPTVDTRYGDPFYFLHPKEHRAFTIREAARVQGFPDTFVFCGNERSQYRMIGNAVPPPLAKCLAEFVLRTIIGG